MLPSILLGGNKTDHSACNLQVDARAAITTPAHDDAWALKSFCSSKRYELQASVWQAACSTPPLGATKS
jgi:hypothetical protein